MPSEEFKSKEFDALKRINFYGTLLITMGILQSLTPGLSNHGWGLPLLVGGLICLNFKSPYGLALAAATMAVVGFSELISFFFRLENLIGLLLLFLSVFPYLDYRRTFFTEEGNAVSQMNPKHAQIIRTFPKIGFSISVFGLLGYSGLMFLLALTVGSAFDQSIHTNSLTELAVKIFFNLSHLITCCHLSGFLFGVGLFGVALSIFSLVVKQAPKWMAWAGILCGGLLLVFYLVFPQLFRQIQLALDILQ
jgi:hypothetical protein